MSLTVNPTSIQLTLLNNSARNNAALGQVTERLATGLRINRASDDPAGMISAQQLKGDLIAFESRSRGAGDLLRQIDVQQRGRQIASDVLTDLRGLALEAADSFTSDEQRQAIQSQIDSSLDSLDTLGAITGFAVPAELESLRQGGSASITGGNSAEAVDVIDEQISAINLASAAAGAYQKYTLEVDQRIAEDQTVATAAALSQQQDADYAEESSKLVKHQILATASHATQRLAQQLQREGLLGLFSILA